MAAFDANVLAGRILAAVQDFTAAGVVDEKIASHISFHVTEAWCEGYRAGYGASDADHQPGGYLDTIARAARSSRKAVA